MAKLCGKVIIVICNTQASGTDDDPFSAEDRKEMIQQTLQAEDLIPKYDIEFREIEDMKDDAIWADAICQACGEISTVWTGDDKTKACFEEKGIEVKDIVLVPGISGEDIRAKMKAKDKSWTQQVPAEVMKFID